MRCLDHNLYNIYLCNIAKILEKLVLSKVSSYLNSHNLYNNCQSGYRPGHSAETALLKFVDDLFLSLDKGNISVLALLDFSLAFDTIDHTILVHRLHTDFGSTDTVLQWSSSYLTDRTQCVSLSNHCSAFAPVHSGVPLGSVLGPILFTMYIKPLTAIIDSHSVIHHSFADDLQLLMSVPPDRISELLHSMLSCMSDIYCNSLLFGSAHDVTSHLQRIQNYAARVIWRLPNSSSITIHLKSLHWLPVKMRSTYKIDCFCYHCHSSTAPSYVTDMLHRNPLHTRNTRSSAYTMPLLNRPAHSKATLVDRSFSFASSSVWNSIPNDVRCAPSLSSYKSRLKTYLFRSVYKD